MDGKIFARKSLLSFSAIVQPEKSDEYPGENKFEFSIRCNAWWADITSSTKMFNMHVCRLKIKRESTTKRMDSVLHNSLVFSRSQLVTFIIFLYSNVQFLDNMKRSTGLKSGWHSKGLFLLRLHMAIPKTLCSLYVRICWCCSQGGGTQQSEGYTSFPQPTH